jgi:hypothetical protein
MMPYSLLALLSITLFAVVHLFAEKTQKLNKISHGRFLSLGSGLAIAYVFVDILPKLAKRGQVVQQAFIGIFPFVERHVYVITLAGFLLFFSVNQMPKVMPTRKTFWLSLASYAFFNFLVGYAVVDKDNPEVKPLALFTLAIALHFFTNDYTLSERHGEEYRKKGRWLLIVSLFLGWASGIGTTIPPAAIAIASAFIAGGVIMNVTQHELPEENPHSLGVFLLTAIFYTILLLSVGS